MIDYPECFGGLAKERLGVYLVGICWDIFTWFVVAAIYSWVIANHPGRGITLRSLRRANDPTQPRCSVWPRRNLSSSPWNWIYVAGGRETRFEKMHDQKPKCSKGWKYFQSSTVYNYKFISPCQVKTEVLSISNMLKICNSYNYNCILPVFLLWWELYKVYQNACVCRVETSIRTRQNNNQNKFVCFMCVWEVVCFMHPNILDCVYHIQYISSWGSLLVLDEREDKTVSDTAEQPEETSDNSLHIHQ